MAVYFFVEINNLYLNMYQMNKKNNRDEVRLLRN